MLADAIRELSTSKETWIKDGTEAINARGSIKILNTERVISLHLVAFISNYKKKKKP